MENAVARIEFPELFFGIVSPVGAETQPTIQALKRFLEREGYHVVDIKVTDNFSSISKYIKPKTKLEKFPTNLRIQSHIDYGNQIRETFKDNSVLAAYSIFKVSQNRRRHTKHLTTKNQFSKRAYIIHQFKRKEEIDLLRAVYGRVFFQISVYSNKEARISYLAQKLAHEHNVADHSAFRSIANDLVSRDENEKDNDRGQRVTKIFHDADFIVNIDYLHKDVYQQVDRFCELIFSSNKISPTRYEYGMFAAKGAALRTLDLSRQVGAAIFRATGEIISMGSNEVPKARGGTYWTDDDPYDAREYALQKDSNDARKRELLKELFDATTDGREFEEWVQTKPIKDSQFMDALEYGRIVHAEMNAITDAARLGLPTKGAILFCTTFPCHMCAKHIVSSGIDRVVFLEPYPKSLAADLHSDSIDVEGGPRGKYDAFEAVHFEHFFGVTPRRYREFFERDRRKKGVNFEEYIRGQKRPNIEYKAPYYVDLENKVIIAGTEALNALMARET